MTRTPYPLGQTGQLHLLRQLHVHRGGHCTFTFAEVLTALDVIVGRIESGTWPPLEPVALNAAANRLGPDANVLPNGRSTPPAFCDFQPPPFTRRYDAGSKDGAGD